MLRVVRLRIVPLMMGVGIFLCARSGAAQAPGLRTGGELLVVNQGDASVSVIGGAAGRSTAGRTLATVAEGVPQMLGHEVAALPDGSYAFVPLYGDAGVGKPGTNGRTMLVVDLRSNAVVDRVDFGHGVRPHCVVHNPVDGLLYVTTELDESVTVVDPHSRRVVGSIPTGQAQSHMLAISHDGRRGYTANVGPGTVSVLDLGKRSLITTIPVSTNTQRISISNDDSRVFTSDQTSPRLAVIDTATNTVRQWVELPAVGYGSSPTPDGRYLLVTLPSTGGLAAVDLKTMKVVHEVHVGEHPQAVLARPDGAVAYVSLLGGHEVVPVDLTTWKAGASLEAGKKADGMAWVGRSR